MLRLLPLVALLLAGCAGTAPPTIDPVLPHDSLDVASAVLSETRRINVYTPPGYDADTSRAYPVLYMPDGGIVAEDFPHITNTVDALIRDGSVAPLLVVGIQNTDRRRDLTGPTTVASDREAAPTGGGSAAFRAFIRDELIPEIDRRYRTDGQRAIVGESLSGLFVVETFVLEPDLFSRSIAMDPSLWWNDGALAQQAPARLAADSTRRVLWIASSGAEGMQERTDAFAAALRTAAPASVRWTVVPMPDEQHNTIFRAAKEAAFRAALWPATPR